ncbi:MAG: glycosyltransferase family 39 protein [Terriglobales bacterium]
MATTTAVPEKRPFLSDGMTTVLAMSAALLVLHCIFNNRYDYFRDEFDYLACAKHLAGGYVDQPPLIPWLARLSLITLGPSLRAIRFLPAFFMSLTVALTAKIARELGGRTFALICAAAAAVAAPVYLNDGSLLTTNCLEPLLWSGCAYFAIRAAQHDQPRYWLWFGVVAGIGMLEKYSIAVFAFAVVIGLLLTEQRRVLVNRWIWIGGLTAFVIFLPNFLWNVHYHWPFIELMRNIKAEGRDIALSPLEYFRQQCLMMQPIVAPLWIGGLLALLLWRPFRAYRVLGWSYLVSLTVFIVLHGKNYYLAPIYPMLLAAGSVRFEHALDRPHFSWLKPLSVTLILAGGAWLAPVVMPVLSVDHYIAYQDKLPLKVPRSEHSHMAAALPQHYADQFGWREIVSEVAVAWNRIPPAERSDCGIFAQDYGAAGAIDWYGSAYGLPHSLSGHQTWFLWGPRGYSGNCLIVLDDTRERLERMFNDVEFVGNSPDNPYALEKGVPVFICKGKKFDGTLAEVWPHLKHWR